MDTRSIPSGKISRKEFIDIAWKSLLALCSALGLGSICRFLSYQPKPSSATLFDLGPVEDLPTGALLSVPEAQAVLLSSDQGFRSFSLVCPHLGCLVESHADKFTCPCHGSTFTLSGELEKGPADRSLPNLDLTISGNGHLILDTSQS